MARRRGTAALVAIASLLPFSLVVGRAPAFGATNGSWQLLPTPAAGRQPGRVYLVYDARPGAVIRDSITLTNLTEGEISFRLRSADAVNARGNAAWALQPAPVQPIDAGAWVRLARREVTVPAQASIDIPIDVRIPTDARPGDHAGGVIAANAKPDRSVRRGSARVDVVREVGVRLYIRVAGRLSPAAAVTDVQLVHAAPALGVIGGAVRGTLHYRIRNTGNTRLSMTARARITGDTGGRVVRFPERSMPDLLPGATVTVEEPWTSRRALGRLTARVDLTAGEVTDAAAVSAWVVPWPSVGVLVALAGAALALVRRTRRRWRQTPTGSRGDLAATGGSPGP